MLIGVDFDNTIVCYDDLFRIVALERGLIPREILASKLAVRDYLRGIGKEDLWIELQGYVYGTRMSQARPFPGVTEFFARCRSRDIPIFIVSHRSRFPYRGDTHDLHQAARDWLVALKFHDAAGIGLPAQRVHFELTGRDKENRIRELGCTHFIDDLPEFLAELSEPVDIQKILFDPNGHNATNVTVAGARRMASWDEIGRHLLGSES
jgi:hypothetical protein